jgi:hypothetical protein
VHQAERVDCFGATAQPSGDKSPRHNGITLVWRFYGARKYKSSSNPRQKKASARLALGIAVRSGRVCGHFCIVGNQRNEGVLLAVGELSEALKQFALMQ